MDLAADAPQSVASTPTSSIFASVGSRAILDTGVNTSPTSVSTSSAAASNSSTNNRRKLGKEAVASNKRSNTSQSKEPARRNNHRATFAGDTCIISDDLELVLRDNVSANIHVVDPTAVSAQTDWVARRNRTYKDLEPYHDRVIVPIYHEASAHWTLGLVDVTTNRITTYDPLFDNKRLQTCEQAMRHFLEWAYGSVEEKWTFIALKKEDALQQEDSKNCGIFMIVVALHLCHHIPMPVRLDQVHVRVWREYFRTGSVQIANPLPKICPGKFDLGKPVQGLLKEAEEQMKRLPDYRTYEAVSIVCLHVVRLVRILRSRALQESQKLDSLQELAEDGACGCDRGVYESLKQGRKANTKRRDGLDKRLSDVERAGRAYGELYNQYLLLHKLIDHLKKSNETIRQLHDRTRDTSTTTLDSTT